MKKIFTMSIMTHNHLSWILFSILLFSSMASSYRGSNLAGLATIIGGTLFVSNQANVGLVPQELTNWKQAHGTTSNLGYQCGLLFETRIYETPRTNMLFIGISNKSDQSKSLVMEKAEFKFSERRVRFPKFNQPTVKVDSGWYAWGVTAFPEKSDFEHSDSFTFSIDVIDSKTKQTCKLTSRHQRNLTLPDYEETYTKYTGLDVIFSLGSLQFSSGVLKNLQMENGAHLNLIFSGYGSINHGFEYLLGAGNLGAPNSEFTENQPTIDWITRYALTSLSYVYRHPFGELHKVYLKTGLKYTGLSIEARESKNEIDDLGSVSYLSIPISLAYDYIYSDVPSGYWHGEYAIGLSFDFDYYFEADTFGEKSDATSSALMIYFRLGN